MKTPQPCFVALFRSRHRLDWEPEQDYHELKFALHELRRRSGLSVYELANRIGVKSNNLSQIEYTGRGFRQLEIYLRCAEIAAAYGLTQLAAYLETEYHLQLRKPRLQKRKEDE